MAEKQKRHYSEKGGHKARSEYHRVQSELLRRNSEMFMRFVPQGSLTLDTWRDRRLMRRISDSGRR